MAAGTPGFLSPARPADEEDVRRLVRLADRLRDLDAVRDHDLAGAEPARRVREERRATITSRARRRIGRAARAPARRARRRALELDDVRLAGRKRGDRKAANGRGRGRHPALPAAPRARTRGGRPEEHASHGRRRRFPTSVAVGDPKWRKTPARRPRPPPRRPQGSTASATKSPATSLVPRVRRRQDDDLHGGGGEDDGAASASNANTKK